MLSSRSSPPIKSPIITVVSNIINNIIVTDMINVGSYLNVSVTSKAYKMQL